ncbi:hypothetical protein F8A87_08315 [Betaproteobacteria bacterium SCN2]|nr:hypothetical protein F8A87_08315 [Betaproteobacteria bacterium SCN2]
MNTVKHRLESKTVLNPLPGVAGLYQLIAPSSENHGQHDCLMWVAMPSGAVAYVRKDWAGTPEEACQSMLDHLGKGVDSILNEAHDAVAWEPMVCAALDPSALEGEIIRRYWDGNYDESNDGWLGRSSAEITQAKQDLTRFIGLLDAEAFGILKKLRTHDRGMFPNVAAYNLIDCDDSRCSHYRRQAFAIFPWLARYLCHELPEEWANCRRDDDKMSFCGERSKVLACIDQGLKLIHFLSGHFDVPAAALRRTKGLHLTALFKAVRDEFQPMLKALSMQPGWKYLAQEGDVALLAAHYWRISLGLGRINERVIGGLWEMPATALKRLTGYQKLPMSVLEKEQEDLRFPAVSGVSDFLDALADGVAHHRRISSIKARRTVRRWAFKTGPKTLTKISDHWHEKMRNTKGIAGDPSGKGISWTPLLDSSIRLGKRMIVELNDEVSLWQEGNAMGHCVGSYAQKCLLYGLRIFSIRDLDGNHVSTLAMKPDTDDDAIFDLLILPLDPDAEADAQDGSRRQVMIDRYYYEMPSLVMNKTFSYIFMEHSGPRNEDPSMDCIEATNLLRDLINSDNCEPRRQAIYEECLKTNATPLGGESDMTAGTLALGSLERFVGNAFRLPNRID